MKLPVISMIFLFHPLGIRFIFQNAEKDIPKTFENKKFWEYNRREE